MARVPEWLHPHVSGRPAWAYATGPIEPLLWAALEERKGGAEGPAAGAYFGALDDRWARCVARGQLAPGAWIWRAHDGAEAPVPSGAALVCTCGESVRCHLDELAPHLVAAGWEVVPRGGALRARVEAHPVEVLEG
jgi:hypothetical protein